MKGGALTKVARALIDRGLMRQVRTRGGMPIWQRDEDDQSLSLVITRTGKRAIAFEEKPADDPAPQQFDPAANLSEYAAAHLDSREEPVALPSFGDPNGSTSPSPRAGTKQALLIAMLKRSEGTAIDEMIAATNWLPHTTRAALTGLRKRGYGIERSRGANGKTTYRIVSAAVPAIRDGLEPTMKVAADAI
jgi:hypothetical protein